MSDEYKSELAKIIEMHAQARDVEEFDVSGFFHLGDKRVPKLGVRALLKSEQDAAIDDAAKYLKDNIHHDEARKDEDVWRDVKLACVAWYACREEGKPHYNAFPSPSWMCSNMSSEQIGVLVNLVNAVRAKAAPTPVQFDASVLDGIVDACASLSATDMPDRVLGGWPREVLVHAFVLLSVRCTRLQEQLAALERAARGELPDGIEIKDLPDVPADEPEASA